MLCLGGHLSCDSSGSKEDFRGPLTMDGGPQGWTHTIPESEGTLAFSQEVKELSSGPYLLELNSDSFVW